MPLPFIAPAQLKAFRRIRQSFSISRLPSKDSWRTASNDDVWMRVVSQVAVVGNAGPADRLWEPAIRNRIKWERLRTLSEPDAKKAIWSVLRTIKTRYSGTRISSCRKTKALMSNLNVLRNHHGGPKGFLKSVAALPGSSAEKVQYVSNHLHYIKNKGARDFLTTGFGLAKDLIALDIRLLGILRAVGISIPKYVQSNAASLSAQYICRPVPNRVTM